MQPSYDSEIREHASHFTPGVLSVEEHARVSVETAYRRGFHQGAYFAVDAMVHGEKVGGLLQWVKKLRNWRSERHAGKWQPPPMAPGWPWLG